LYLLDGRHLKRGVQMKVVEVEIIRPFGRTEISLFLFTHIL
jgi:hypothetical protein